MKKIIILFSIILLALACKAQQITATADWQTQPGAVKYHIFVWEGSNPDNNPLEEDSSYNYTGNLGLTHYIIMPPDTALSFQTQVNGNYIQCAGFIENELGIISIAHLSEMLLKPSEPVKMQFLHLRFL